MVPALMTDVGANILPLWVQTYYIQLWAQKFCLCRCQKFASVGTKILPLCAQTNYIQLWAQNVCLCGRKFFASVGAKLLPLQSQNFFCLCVDKLTTVDMLTMHIVTMHKCHNA